MAVNGSMHFNLWEWEGLLQQQLRNVRLQLGLNTSGMHNNA